MNNISKLYDSATKNLPHDQDVRLYPLPDKHLANTSLDRVHTTRRAQVLSQAVNEQVESVDNSKASGLVIQERVFLRTNPKPLETSTTFPDSLINSENNFHLFCKADQRKAIVFQNYKQMNRDLTKAYLRQIENKNLFSKAKGGALPE